MTSTVPRNAAATAVLSVGLQTIFYYLPELYTRANLSTVPTLLLREVFRPGDFEPTMFFSAAKAALLIFAIALYVHLVNRVARRVIPASRSSLAIIVGLSVVTLSFAVLLAWPEITLVAFDRNRMQLTQVERIGDFVYGAVPGGNLGLAACAVLCQSALFVWLCRGMSR